MRKNAPISRISVILLGSVMKGSYQLLINQLLMEHISY